MVRNIPVIRAGYPTVALGNLDRGECFIRTNPTDKDNPCVYMHTGPQYTVNRGPCGEVTTVSLRSGCVQSFRADDQVVRVDLAVQAYIK